VQELSQPNLSQQEKNLALDKLRKQIQNEADLALKAQFKLPHGTNATEFTERFNHNLENMPSFGKPITIIQKNPNNTVDVLETAQKTAHELGAKKDTTAKLSRYALEPNGQPALLYSTYRTDILVPHSKTFKSTADVELEQKKATVEKIKKIARKFEGDSPIFYNLFTSIHSRFRIGEGKNEQTPRLKILLKAQDEYNLSLQSPKDVSKEKVGANYFFTLNIPTNGFGYEPSPDSFFSSEAKEMALRNDMAIAMILGNQPQKESLIKKYKDFLIAKPRPDFITGSRFEQAIKTEINNIKASLAIPSPEKESLATPSPENPFKTTLALLYKNNLHYKHEYARLTQTMAILCEDKSINGCKSGNERTAGILGRVEQAQALKDEISVILKQEGTDVQKVQNISKAIDEAYNKKGIYGISSDISLSDQGAVSKIETQLPYLSNLNPINWFKNIVRFFKNNIDTNRAEPSTIGKMQNSNTGSMQAHKVNGFNVNFFSEVEKLRETPTSTTTQASSVPSLYTAIGQLNTHLKEIEVPTFNSGADYQSTIDRLKTEVEKLERLSGEANQQAETDGDANRVASTKKLVQTAQETIQKTQQTIQDLQQRLAELNTEAVKTPLGARGFSGTERQRSVKSQGSAQLASNSAGASEDQADFIKGYTSAQVQELKETFKDKFSSVKELLRNAVELEHKQTGKPVTQEDYNKKGITQEEIEELDHKMAMQLQAKEIGNFKNPLTSQTQTDTSHSEIFDEPNPQISQGPKK